MTFGLNLYSIRNLIKTEEAFNKTAEKLKEMGYQSIQYSGGPYDAEMIRRVSTRHGLPVVLTHVPIERILRDTDTLMAEHESFGCHNIGLGMMPKTSLADKKQFVKTVADLERVGEYMESRGFRFFYHHHHVEFSKFNNQTLFDYMVENAPHIHFTADTYWLQYGGVDICDTIDRLAGRVECLHLKDYRIIPNPEKEGAYLPIISSVGDGNIDFQKVIAHAKAAGTRHFLVEQDNAADASDPAAEVERSIRYLTRHFGK